MPRLKPLDEGFALAPTELAFASQAFGLAWTRICHEFVGRRDATHAARDLLARAVLSHIRQPLGEPEVVALRAIRTYRAILPVAALDRELRRKVGDPDHNVRACRETAVLLRHSRALIDWISAHQREIRVSSPLRLRSTRTGITLRVRTHPAIITFLHVAGALPSVKNPILAECL